MFLQHSINYTCSTFHFDTHAQTTSKFISVIHEFFISFSLKLFFESWRMLFRLRFSSKLFRLRRVQQPPFLPQIRRREPPVYFSERRKITRARNSATKVKKQVASMSKSAVTRIEPRRMPNYEAYLGTSRSATARSTVAPPPSSSWRAASRQTPRFRVRV